MVALRQRGARGLLWAGGNVFLESVMNGGDMVRMGALVRKRICMCANVFKVAVYKLVKI